MQIIEKNHRIGRYHIFIDRSHVMMALGVVGLMAAIALVPVMNWGLNEGGPPQITLTCSVLEGHLAGVLKCNGVLPDENGKLTREVKNLAVLWNEDTGDYEIATGGKSGWQEVVYKPTTNVVTGPPQAVKFRKRFV